MNLTNLTNLTNPSSLPSAAHTLTLFQATANLTAYERRVLICRLERAMFEAAAKGEFIPADFPLLHEYDQGHYIRTIFLPKGTIVIGRIHKLSHFNYISKGHVAVLTEAEGFQELRGYWEGWNPPGTKRAIYCFEDTWWTTIHKTDETDPDRIKLNVIADSYTEMGWDDPMEYLKLEAPQAQGAVQ